MYYQSYEDYMRAVLGYHMERQNTYSSFNNNYLQFNDENLVNQDTDRLNSQNDNFIDMYPEIYKIVNPMVCKVCEGNNEPITKELVLKMTDEVYKNLEETEMTVINVRATVNNEKNTPTNEQRQQNRTIKPNTQTSQQITQQRNNNTNIESRENREIKEVRETRQVRPSNNLLRDLIQILILKRLLEGNRPPIGRPPKPPVNPGPPRPPIRPREYSDYYKF